MATIGELRKLRNECGLCADCGDAPYVEGRKRCYDCLTAARVKAAHYRDNPDGLSKSAKSSRDSNRRLREQAVDAYGGVCVCCGEYRFEFLTFDHINNDGNIDRLGAFGTNKGASSSAVIRRLREEGWPDYIQLLCWNCNCAKAYHGICPHELERRY